MRAKGKKMSLEFQLLRSESKIFIAGHRGLVGSSVVRKLRGLNFNNLILKNKNELNLLNQSDVLSFFSNNQIDYVIMAAAKCGSIKDNNQYPADYFYENAMMALNIIQGSFRANVKKLLYLGSSCLYPKDLSGSIREQDILSGPLESTNLSYSIAKISGIEFCRAIYKQYGCCFISAIPTNTFGPEDNFNPDSSHVIPALIRKVHEALKNGKNYITIWGTGRPLRNFLYVDDLSEALVLILDKYSDIDPINIGHVDKTSITDIALMICKALGYEGELRYDISRPDGTFSKYLCLDKITSLGFTPKTKFFVGIKKTYQWALENGVLKN